MHLYLNNKTAKPISRGPILSGVFDDDDNGVIVYNGGFEKQEFLKNYEQHVRSSTLHGEEMENTLPKAEARKVVISAEPKSSHLTPKSLIVHSSFFVAMAVTLTVFLLLAAGFVLHRKKKIKSPKVQEESLILPKRKHSSPVDPTYYNYVCPQQPIDFVIPLPPVHSPLEPNNSFAKSPVMPKSPKSSWTDLTCLDSGPVLGGLNPDLYKVSAEKCSNEFDFPEGHCGRLWFSLDYNIALERLSVHLIKATNLPSRTYGSLNYCDPFVRISLLPDERRYVQSRMRKKTCNPFFDETFIFQLPVVSISERTIKFTVYDNDGGKPYVLIGHVTMPLHELNTSSPTPVVQWRDLEKEVKIQVPYDLGEIMISLCYNRNLERLIVTICEAKSLRPPKGCQSLDTFVKIMFMKENKITKTKKTTIVRNSTHPKYNESFHFKMAQSSIAMHCIILQVTQAGIKSKDNSLGRVVLGSYMFSRGKGLEHWEESMSVGHKQIRYWHKLT